MKIARANSLTVCRHIRSGVYFDSKLTMQTHVAKVMQTCFFQLRRLRQIRRLLGRDVTANVVAALVLTRLDYGNALLAGLPYSCNHCTAAARHQCCYETIVYGLRLRDHVTDAIIELHWLPIRATFQAVSAGPPGIERPVTELGRRAATACHHKTGLPSADNNALLVPRTSLKFGAQRAFSVAGPAAWNSLPTDIQTTSTTAAFKKKLQTFLFHNLYDVIVY